jgi:endonuclease-3
MKGIDNQLLPNILKEVEAMISPFEVPVVTYFQSKTRNPFIVLISTMLSLRTKDYVTRKATERLLKLGTSPRELASVSEEKIEKAIYPVGFYKTKAKNIRKTALILNEKHNGKVPNKMEELLALPGVGRKTANLVLGEGFGIPAICVDTHVHRISNRWGYVKTSNPEETEMALRKKLPKKYWIIYNTLLVTFGQNICVPISPFCSKCSISQKCPKIGVESSR